MQEETGWQNCQRIRHCCWRLCSKAFVRWAVCTLSCFQNMMDQFICHNPNFCGMTVWVQIVVTLMAHLPWCFIVTEPTRLSESSVSNPHWFFIMAGPMRMSGSSFSNLHCIFIMAGPTRLSRSTVSNLHCIFIVARLTRLKTFYIEPIARWADFIDFTLLISIWHCHDSINTLSLSTNDWLCRELLVKCKVIGWFPTDLWTGRSNDANVSPSEFAAWVSCWQPFLVKIEFEWMPESVQQGFCKGWIPESVQQCFCKGFSL